jgi:hypothetical protein
MYGLHLITPATLLWFVNYVDANIAKQALT